MYITLDGTHTHCAGLPYHNFTTIPFTTFYLPYFLLFNSMWLQACDELIQLIKDQGRWVDPPKEEEAVAAA